MTLSPFGICTVSRRDAGSMSMTGASVTRKWLVAPESKIAQSFRSSTLISTVCSNDYAACRYVGISKCGVGCVTSDWIHGTGKVFFGLLVTEGGFAGLVVSVGLGSAFKGLLMCLDG